MSSLEFVPSPVRLQVAQLAASVVERAASLGEGRWGLTPSLGAIRLNVGWTEILTADSGGIRLIVDGQLARDAGLSEDLFEASEDSRGFYPTIPGSVCVAIPYEPATRLKNAIGSLQAALTQSIRLAARRGAGRGVKAGHRQEAVATLASLVGRELPNPGYAAQDEQDLSANSALMEGALRRVVSSEYERNPAARVACIEHYGASCVVCGFSFESMYGEFGRGFIHVHHLTPVSAIGKEYRVDPIADLRPVCPNCHAMLHRQDPPVTIEELRDLMSSETAS